MMKSDVLIIGSGISALTSAILLGSRGKSVTILEQAGKPGGYMHSFRRFGEIYDTGAHYVGALGPGQPFRTLLEYLGVFDEKHFAYLHPDGFDILNFPEGVVNIPQGYDQFASELGAIFPQEKDAIRKYLARVQAAVKYFPTYDFDDSPEVQIPAEIFEESLASVVRSLTSNQRLQSVFYAYCNLHGVYPDDVAFGFHAIVTDSLLRGAYGLTEGGDALTKNFVKRIEELGGKVLLKHRVSELEVKNKNIVSVKCENGAVFSADWVISSIHPKATFSLLSDQSFFTGAFADRLKNMKETTGIFGLYAETKGTMPLRPLSNYYFFRSSNPEAMFAERTPNDEPNTVFVSCPNRLWQPANGSLPLSLHAASPYQWFENWQSSKYGKREGTYSDFKNNFAKKILSLVERYHDGFSETVTQSVTSSPLTNVHFNAAVEGTSYGIYHSIQNTGPRALGPRTKVLNLLLTGQNYLFPGLMGAAISALRTSGHIIGLKPIITELKNFKKETYGNDL